MSEWKRLYVFSLYTSFSLSVRYTIPLSEHSSMQSNLSYTGNQILSIGLWLHLLLLYQYIWRKEVSLFGSLRISLDLGFCAWSKELAMTWMIFLERLSLVSCFYLMIKAEVGTLSFLLITLVAHIFLPYLMHFNSIGKKFSLQV